MAAAADEDPRKEYVKLMERRHTLEVRLTFSLSFSLLSLSLSLSLPLSSLYLPSLSLPLPSLSPVLALTVPSAARLCERSPFLRFPPAPSSPPSRLLLSHRSPAPLSRTHTPMARALSVSFKSSSSRCVSSRRFFDFVPTARHTASRLSLCLALHNRNNRSTTTRGHTSETPRWETPSSAGTSSERAMGRP